VGLSFWKNDTAIVTELEQTVDEQEKKIEMLERSLAQYQLNQTKYENLQKSVELEDRWSAIDRVMAIIEFDLSGNIFDGV